MLYSVFSDKFLEAMSQSEVCLLYAVEIQFASGTTRVHSGVGTIVVDGQSFLGVGSLGEIGSASVNNNTSPSEVTVALTGLDPSMIGEILNDRVVGKNGRIICAVFDEDAGEVIAADTLFEGFVSRTALNAGTTNAFTLTLSNIFEKWQNGLPHRYTDESHTRVYPGDRIFRYCAQMADRSIFWGSKQDAPGFRYEG